MRQLLILTCGLLMISSVANACEGITIKGKYCLSEHTMNWYSAYAWCEAQGLNMIDLNSVCGVGGWSTCSALILTADEQSEAGTNSTFINGINWVWSKDSHTASKPWSVQLVTGGISSDRSSHGERTVKGRALCK